MHYYEVMPNRIIRIGSDHFTYCSEQIIKIGQIVLVEVGKNKVVGVVTKKVAQPTYKTKSILKIIIERPLPIQLLKLSVWLSQYYVTPVATVLQTMLPAGINKNRRSMKSEINLTKRTRTNIVFNNEQREAIKSLNKYEDGTFLLQGITGSGKTAVYIELIRQALAKGRSALVIVPEIALTSQLISELSNHFDNLLVTHSKMTEAARHVIWLNALMSETPLVAIGPRSALFMPLVNVGAIIIDEAHEPSLKQDQSPKYSALRVATMLGRFHKSKVLFGSATPDVVDRYLASKSNRPILKLEKLARPDGRPPVINSIDMTKRDNFKRNRIFSDQLLDQIEQTLAAHEQVLIFHNRRGSASTTLCENCGWMAECPRCFLPLALHSDNYILKCHVCGYGSPVATCCPLCSHTDIIHKGIGTKLIESTLNKLFPDAIIARFDADNSNDEALNTRYQELYDGKIDIIIGTQIIAKGLDLPHLRTVGVIQADTGLLLPDYGASERTFQLLSQVIGRVGRNEHATSVIVQSYHQDHPSIAFGLKQDYEGFYEYALSERQKGLFPPFTFLAKLTCSYKTEATAIKNSRETAKKIINQFGENIQVLGPTPCFHEQQFRSYRWQIVLKSSKREYLINAVQSLPKNGWQADLDAHSLI